MDSFNEAWDVICEYCEQHITKVAYNTWISRIKPVKMDFAEGKAIFKNVRTIAEYVSNHRTK